MLVRKDGRLRLTGQYGLEIPEVEQRDGGQYSCQLDIFGNPVSITHTLHVIGKVPVPTPLHAVAFRVTLICNLAATYAYVHYIRSVYINKTKVWTLWTVCEACAEKL